LALLTACGADGTGPGIGVPRTGLLALPRTDSSFAPAPTTTMSVHNDALNSFVIRETDGAATVFATFTFPARSIVAVGSLQVCDTCTVTVTVTLAAGTYGFTVAPAGLVFNLSNEPTVAVGYGTYGDLSVYTQSPKYGTSAAYEQALALYRERTADHWLPGRNSSHTGGFTVSSAVETPGAYLIAAPK